MTNLSAEARAEIMGKVSKLEKEMSDETTDNNLKNIKKGNDKRDEQRRIAKKLAKDAKAYKEMTESDGAAFMTFDAYRTLRFMNDKWSTAQEALYQQIINGEEVDPKKVKEFFPIYKLQYYGSIANAPIATELLPCVN